MDKKIQWRKGNVYPGVSPVWACLSHFYHATIAPHHVSFPIVSTPLSPSLACARPSAAYTYMDENISFYTSLLGSKWVKVVLSLPTGRPDTLGSCIVIFFFFFLIV